MRWVLVVALGLHSILALLRFNAFPVGAYVDDAHYVVLAEALATGQGFCLVNFPEPQAELMFPPGWPLLLSPLVALFPGSFTPLKLLSLLLNLASILLAYRLAAPRLQRPFLGLLLVLMAIHPALVGSSGMVMSEAAYLFASLLALNLFELWLRQSERPLNRFLLPFAWVTIAAQLIRPVGLSMLLSVLVCLALQQRTRHLALITTVLVVGLIPQTLLFSQSGGSVIPVAKEHRVLGDASLVEKPLHMAMTFGTYLQEKLVSNMLLPIFGPRISAWPARLGLGFLPVMLNAVLLLIVGSGFVRSLRRPQLSEIYVLSYSVAVLSFWNPLVGSAQSRFLIPLVPFLLLYFLEGISALFSFAVRRTGHPEKLAVGVAVLVLVAIGVPFLGRNVQETINPFRDRSTDLSAGADWIRAHAPHDAIIMTQDPIPRYLYARRRTVDYSTAVDTAAILDEIERKGANYILVAPPLRSSTSTELDEYTVGHLLPLLQKHPEWFYPCYQDPEHGVAIYRIRGTFGHSSTGCTLDAKQSVPRTDPNLDGIRKARFP